jgi:ribose transport system permease protein
MDDQQVVNGKQEMCPPLTAKRRSDFRTTLLVRLGSFAPLITLLVLMLLFTLTSSKFLTVTNLLNISAQISILSMVAAGMTLVILTGEIDLSVANIAMMSGLLMALFYQSDWPLLGSNAFFSILTAILAAAGLGVVTGVSVTKLGIPSFAVTLATMQISRGVTMTVTEGRPIYQLPEPITALASARIGSVPALAVMAAVVLVFFYLILRYSHYGRYLYAVGGNRVAARLVGIRTSFITFSALLISATMAGIGGVLNTGRLGSAQTFGSEDLLIDSLAAVVIGGTSLAGGIGGIGNTILGILILGVLNNGLNQMSTNIFMKYLFKGIILLLALVINVLSVKLKNRATTMARADRYDEGSATPS